MNNEISCSFPLLIMPNVETFVIFLNMDILLVILGYHFLFFVVLLVAFPLNGNS